LFALECEEVKMRYENFFVPVTETKTFKGRIFSFKNVGSVQHPQYRLYVRMVQEDQHADREVEMPQRRGKRGGSWFRIGKDKFKIGSRGRTGITLYQEVRANPATKATDSRRKKNHQCKVTAAKTSKSAAAEKQWKMRIKL
jgi:hypothetical protein